MSHTADSATCDAKDAAAARRHTVVDRIRVLREVEQSHFTTMGDDAGEVSARRNEAAVAMAETSIVEVWTTVDLSALPVLAKDEVQLWRVDLPAEATLLEPYLWSLSSEERARAERLRQGTVRLQFVVARACLRTLLGSVLGTDPKQVSITASNFGKPQTPGVLYNVAHSGQAILIALSRARSVGVDVEYFSRAVEALEIAKSSFAAKEYQKLASIEDADELRRAFFQCWTRKEAVIKADGRGLSLALDSFEVPIGDMPGDTRVSIPRSEHGKEETYCVRDIPWGGDVAAAYAVAGADCSARRFLFAQDMLTHKR